MIIIVSICISIFILYEGAKYLYSSYKEEIDQIDDDLKELKKFKNKQESDNVANLKLLQWLYDDLSAKGIISIEKAQEDLKDGDKSERR